MTRKFLAGLMLAFLPGFVGAAEPAPNDVVLDTWDIAYLGKTRAGFVHTQTRTVTRDGEKYYKTTSELNLTVKRFQDAATLRMETGSEEGEDGKVSAVSMRQFLGRDQETVMAGTVEEDELHILVHDLRGGEKVQRLDKKNPWDERVVGLYRQQAMYRQRKVKPGDRFDYLSYEPTLTLVIKTQVAVKDFEEVEVNGKKRRLLRVEAVPERIQIGENRVQLPALTAWLDDKYEMIRQEVDVPGLGQLTLYRGKRSDLNAPAAATASGAQVAPDIGLEQLVKLDARIPARYAAEEVVYRITLKGDKDAASAFAQDERQKVENAKGESFDLRVRARRQAPAPKKAAPVADEYLGSSYFINASDPTVKALATKAVGQEKDPWLRAVLIERWVHNNMTKKNYTQAFATADHVAKNREGDCTEHAVLAAAMCRAAGIPARTAFGLIYIENGPQPAMGFHMWTEVFVRGQWVSIDATLGQGFVGATHIKISDHSWHDVQTPTPLLPVVRVVGKVGIQIVSPATRRAG